MRLTALTIRLRIDTTEWAWSTNDDRKINKHERHRLIQTWKEAARLAMRSWLNTHPDVSRPLPFAVVQVVIPFDKRRRRDPHNWCGTVLKAVVDGMVKAGAWPDDTPEWVGHREPVLYVTKDRGARPEVLVTFGEKGMIHDS